MIYLLTILMAFQSKSKFELTVDNPLVNPATTTLDVTDFVESMQDITYSIESNRNELVFPDPVAVTLDNQTKKFFNSAYYAESSTGDQPIFHSRYDGTGTTDYKYFILRREFGSTSQIKYIGKIVQSANRDVVNVNVEDETVSFRTEHIWYELANTLMREVPGIYEGHPFTAGGRKTKTISGKLIDIVEKLLKLTGITTITWDDYSSFFSLTLNGHVYDLQDVYIITPVYREATISRMTAGEVLGELMNLFGIFGVVDFNVFTDGQPFIRLRNKTVSAASPVRTIAKADLIGQAEINTNWKEYSKKGIIANSTTELFHTAITERQQFVDNAAGAIYVTNDYKQGLTVITLSDHDLQVTDRIKFGNHNESYLVEAVNGNQITIFPGLVNYIHDQETVTKDAASELKFKLLECMKLKLKYPNVLAYERGANVLPVKDATVRLFHNVKSTGHIKEYQKPSRFGVAKAINQANRGLGVCVIEGMPINGGAKNHPAGDMMAFVSRLESTGLTQIKLAGTLPKKDIIPSTVIDPVSSVEFVNLDGGNNLQFAIATLGYAFYSGALKRYSGIVGEPAEEESGDYLIVFALGTISGETVLYKFEVQLKENAVDKKQEAEKVFVESFEQTADIVALDMVTILKRDFGSSSEFEHTAGSFVNANPLNPDKDDKFYFAWRILGESGNINRISKAHISDALSGFEPVYSLDSSSLNNLSWVYVDHGQTAQDIYIVNSSLPGQIYKNGLSVGNLYISGGVGSLTPSLGFSRPANDIWTQQPTTCWRSYDGYLFFADLLNNLYVHDPASDLVWNIGEVNECYQLQCVDFVGQWELKEGVIDYRIYDFTHHASRKSHDYYSPKRRPCNLQIRDVNQNIFLGDRLDVDKDAVAAPSAVDNFKGTVTTISLNPFDWSLSLMLKEIIEE